MLARRALPVVGTAHNKAALGFHGALCETGVTHLKAEIRKIGDVRAVGQYLAACRHDMICGNVVAHLQKAGQSHCIRQRQGLRQRLDVWPAQHLHLFEGILRRGQVYHIVVYGRNARAFPPGRQREGWRGLSQSLSGSLRRPSRGSPDTHPRRACRCALRNSG